MSNLERTGCGCRACGCAEGEIPEPGQGGVRALLPSRPARCRPAGAEEGLAVPRSGLDGRRGRSEAAGAGAPCAPTDGGGLAEQPGTPGKPVPTLLVHPSGKTCSSCGV